MPSKDLGSIVHLNVIHLKYKSKQHHSYWHYSLTNIRFAYNSYYIVSTGGGDQCVEKLRIYMRTTTILYGSITFKFFSFF